MIPVVSFYTRNTPYEQEAFAMRESAYGVGLFEVVLFAINSKGTWASNCQQKVEILQQALEVIKGPCLYVDADARFKNRPELLQGAWLRCYDMALHYFKGTELLSGTIWLNSTDHTRKLLEDWKESCTQHPKMWDQRVLAQLLEDNHTIDIYKLPPEYTWIYDLSPKVYGKSEPVIEHYQASRKYKDEINRRQ
jgi:hypothetical protein